MPVALRRITPAVVQSIRYFSGCAVCRFIYFCAVSRLGCICRCLPTLVGMILMLALIVCRILPLQWVRAGARWLLAEMLLFFVPAVVAVVNYAQLLLVDGWRIFAVIALSTVMVLGTTARVVEKVYRYEMRRLNRG